MCNNSLISSCISSHLIPCYMLVKYKSYQFRNQFIQMFHISFPSNRGVLRVAHDGWMQPPSIPGISQRCLIGIHLYPSLSMPIIMSFPENFYPPRLFNLITHECIGCIHYSFVSLYMCMYYHLEYLYEISLTLNRNVANSTINFAVFLS